jgi:CRISPR system Cascade subunit CasE
MILVQSAHPPDWDYAFHNAQYLLAAKPEVKAYQPRLEKGRRLRFRLKANSTRRACKNSRHPSGQPLDSKWIGKRIPVRVEALRDWLDRCAQRSGFHVTALTKTVAGYVYFNETGEKGKSKRLSSVLFEGTLEVDDPTAFATAVRAGMGHGKAFGFGLLSLAPV